MVKWETGDVDVVSQCAVDDDHSGAAPAAVNLTGLSYTTESHWKCSWEGDTARLMVSQKTCLTNVFSFCSGVRAGPIVQSVQIRTFDEY